MRDVIVSPATGWGRELRKGLLDLALLCHLSEDDRHGYALIAALKESGIMAAEGAEATVYQALQRLANAGLASSAWTSPTGSDRPRKVYTITKRGQAALQAMEQEWIAVSGAVDKLLEVAR